ncbi:MAG: TonB-dependent receptor [Sphingobium sp.]|uniref:TonB-dependent receptor n=1 Tax=Sphingobium sp. TaxID=1912891 RepID=UPI0029BE0990|nr:TonB-dependent receptor [Sphingobium sp.]MDX3910317.1 TonB-dependent receptor [Sphingobium sp.]
MLRSRTSEARLALFVSLAAPLLAPESANAQATGAGPQAETGAGVADQAGGIEDIVVTAQRRSESAQSVPISLQSFSSETLQQSGVRSTEDLTSVVGGLIIQPTAARPSIFIRGVGTNSTNTTPAVLTFLDGVYMPFGQSTDLANIASVEVLKGPQGTLFGRNATGGVVQITTRPPSETPGARVEVGYGNYDTVDGTAYITGGLAAGAAMDLALSYSNQGNGFGTNVFNGNDVFLTRRFAARSRLLLNLSDVSTLTLAGDYSQVRGTVGTNVSPSVGYDFLYVAGAVRRRGAFFPGDFDINAGPRTPYFKAKEWGASLTFETEFSGLTFRNITSYRRGKEYAQIDFDGSPLNAVNLSIDRDPRTAFTQELQLLSGDDGPFQWVAGVFYFDSTAKLLPFQINTNAAYAVDKDRSIAAYAQGSYEILPNTKLTLGGRYTIEKRKIDGFVLANGIDVPSRRGSLSQTFREPTWRIALDHNITPTALVYASVSRGFNAGFFNQSSLAGFATEVQNPPVKPEFLTAYEIGAKTDLFARHLRVNISAFLYDYKGLQQQIYDQGAVVTINAGSAEMKGFDFEVVARPVNSLTLSVSGTYLDTKYKSYPLAPNYVLQSNGSIIAVSNLEAAGNRITNAPELSYTASISHVLETGIGEFTTSANVNYRGETYADPINRFELPKRYLVNVTERWTSSDEHVFASLWIKNLFDKRYDYAITVLTPPGLVGLTAPPRTYGFTAGFKF